MATLFLTRRLECTTVSYELSHSTDQSERFRKTGVCLTRSADEIPMLMGIGHDHRMLSSTCALADDILNSTIANLVYFYP